ncbi:tRNA glutamyl-Q(34) synthetase GluQRS [Phyllobacterium sp. YR531]|uniref:tRNA glutamyl-Q(34) synthetase GluQRS n=1 Tax=Phyllobacterium sp. YR531 TaxID=1144343 RepID=UPI00026F9918|nr:tRNA glutamyl-Q(34) synthetase GluQRS [Phyllobacterium sp. YR531]EJM99244.1 glutamyl- or glutaminyl-tRNA synthetase [Phyllobacterium sp. YR531]
MTVPVFRFAPSPNGSLHLGHAYSALLNQKIAHNLHGRLLLRLEDIDRERCTPELEYFMLDELEWIGFSWEQPVRRQSEHFPVYQAALDRLIQMDLVYPAFLSRSGIRDEIERSNIDDWPRDPDGAPLYPHTERELSNRERQARISAGKPFAWRLNMDRAIETTGKPLVWHEFISHENIYARPQDWGDVIIARRDMPTSYHLSVVIDDSLQGITHVVRGKDLYHATSVHRLLQHLFGIEPPLYHHHRLILDESGNKLSKSRKDTSLRSLRQKGMTRQEICDLIGL